MVAAEHPQVEALLRVCAKVHDEPGGVLVRGDAADGAVVAEVFGNAAAVAGWWGLKLDQDEVVVIIVCRRSAAALAVGTIVWSCWRV